MSSDENSNYEEFDKSPLSLSEEKIADFWQKNNIFGKSIKKKSPKGEFVFYEGPPTANGRPGIHHLESRSFKDAIPRYKTMQGYRVNRRAGWDTHGLPVELEVEKQLGFNGKPDIEKYGIAEFNQRCRESVLTYVNEWVAFTDRIAYWLDHNSAYYTFNPNYMESVWWVFARADERGLLYQDYKVLPWCSRCGTALSSHELAQGYKDVKDLSVTAEFRVKSSSIDSLSSSISTSILAWTTTPWTLPGNVALAVGSDIEYSVVEKKDEGSGDLVRFVLASDLVDKVFSDNEVYNTVDRFPGSELVGTTYEPLYKYLGDLIDSEGKQALKDKAYQVYSAEFVTTDDGTGVVHTAVMYGQDDFELGTNIGLPKFHLVDEEGKFINGTDIFAGRFVQDEQVAIDIIRNLAHRGLLFSKEKYEHSYPHCWRCKTPLIYYARESWYIAMSKLRDRLLSNNEQINWEPDYIKTGRMEEWLRGVKDWAVSRERYWGTPLPIWQSESGDRIVISSVADLKKHLPETKFVFVRHGEGDHNVEGVADCDVSSTAALTEKGRGQIEKTVKHLKELNPDILVSSELLRGRQTAEIISNALNLPIETHAGVNEINFGEFNGQPITKWQQARDKYGDVFTYRPKDGESFNDVKNRLNSFMNEMAKKHPGKIIVVATHGAVLETVQMAAAGMTRIEAEKEFEKTKNPANGSWQMITHYPLPVDESGELNLHRPYIDNVVLEKDGEKYHRVKEVMDVWFDSGSMPWAQDHYPFAATDPDKRLSDADFYENKYPADFISEAIDQTRGWFYVLQAIAAFMDLDEAPYKNVICLGHILDAEGQKMSKSKGNTVNPWEMIAKYGADALRFWMYSVNQPGEPKNFDEQTVDEVGKKVFNLLRNSNNFYQMFADYEHASNCKESPNVLDQWILARLDQLGHEVTRNLDNYKLLESTRSIRDFIGDLSQWYIRRSRDRFKGDDELDRSFALATTKYVLKTTAQLMAPFTPYLAEELWLSLRGDNEVESVHLSTWPKIDQSNQELIDQMTQIRDLASEALSLRSDSGFNQRQPLASLTIPDSFKFSDGLKQVLADELNVKKILVAGHKVILDTELTDELKFEGDVRNLIRSIQSSRKQLNLVPDDQIKLILPNEQVLDLLHTVKLELESVAGVNELVMGESGSIGFEVKISGKPWKMFVSPVV